MTPLHPICILIDGTSGSGKSSLASKLADRLRLHHIETGLYFRMLGRHMIEQGFDYQRIHHFAADPGFGPPPQLSPAEASSAIAYVRHLADPGLLSHERHDPAHRLPLSDERVAAAAACFAPLGSIRQSIHRYINNDICTRPAGTHGVVLDGRGMGNEFNNSDVRLFLSASPDERVRRILSRYTTPEARSAAEAELPALMRSRDNRDRKRELAPNHAIFADWSIDNTQLKPQETLNNALEHIDKKLSSRSTGRTRPHSGYTR